MVQEALEMMLCVRGVVGLLVDAHDEGAVLALGGRGDDDLLGAGVDVLLASSALVKRPVDSMTMSTPRSPQRQVRGVPLGEHLDRLAVDDDGVAVRTPRWRRGGP